MPCGVYIIYSSILYKIYNRNASKLKENPPLYPIGDTDVKYLPHEIYTKKYYAKCLSRAKVQ